MASSLASGQQDAKLTLMARNDVADVPNVTVSAPIKTAEMPKNESTIPNKTHKTKNWVGKELTRRREGGHRRRFGDLDGPEFTQKRGISNLKFISIGAPISDAGQVDISLLQGELLPMRTVEP